MSMSFRPAFYIIFCLLLSSCASDFSKNLSPTPTAFGSTNQIVVIADNTVWEGEVGDTLRKYFAAAYPILPQPEPMFDLRHYTMKELLSGPARQELRNYIFLGLTNDSDSPVTKMMTEDLSKNVMEKKVAEKGRGSSLGRDKWALGQQLVYLYGQDETALNEGIIRHFPTIAKRVHDNDLKQVEGILYSGGDNAKIQRKLQSNLDLSMHIPYDFYLAFQDSVNKVMWIRQELKDFSGNLLIKRIPYTDKSQFDMKAMQNLRDALGKKYITSAIKGAYMRTNDQDLPVLSQQITIKDYYAVEMRGIWDMVNDFMGGPFVSYMIHKPNSQELLFIDVFVHAPGKDKRDYVQRLEHIVSSLEL